MSVLREALRDIPDGIYFDLLESSDAYLLLIDFPGASRDDLTLTTDNGSLTIATHRVKPTEDEYSYLEENRPMDLTASVPLPSEVHEGDIEVTISRGVLELFMPKPEPTTEKSIPIDDA